MSDAVEFYWRPGCPFCIALRSRLHRSRSPVWEVNIWEDPDAAARVRAVASGNETVPTVFVGEHALVNPSIKQLTDLVRQSAPQLLEQAEQGRTRRRFWPFSLA
ncbi:MAG TPA: glutaredoxin domain-containing protein [Mycobacterium sp.]